jgi:hypothetical protein
LSITAQKDLDYQLTQQLMIDTRLRGNDTQIINITPNVTPAQAGVQKV